MKHSEVINTFTGKFNGCRYLEIGVDSGSTFFEINAKEKVAVDPDFKFEVPKIVDEGVEFRAETSDQYFASIDKSNKFDVIFIDGLHTFEQTLRDMMNAINHSHDDTVIIVDDVIPNSYTAAISDFNEWIDYRNAAGIEDQSWMGDVFKCVYFTKYFLPSYSYATTLENRGQMIMWKGPRLLKDATLIETIARLEFRHTVTDRETFNIRPFSEIVSEIDIRLGCKKKA